MLLKDGKVFSWGESFIIKLGKLLHENVNCWRKVEKLHMLVRKVKEESKMFYFSENSSLKTKEIDKSMSSVARIWKSFARG